MVRKYIAPHVHRAKIGYERIRPFLPAIFFFSGFTWDSLTLKRIDNWIDTAFLFTYLSALGALIVTSTLVDRGRLQKPWLLAKKQYFPMAAQFLLGGLFSAYVVFYFKSSSVASSFIFLGVLLAFLIANEFMEKKLSNLFVLSSLYFLVLSSFLIFFIPIVIRRLDYFSFSLSVTLSFALVFTGLYVFYRMKIFQNRQELNRCLTMLTTLFIGFHIFYVKNWIPPVPLALKHVGMYYKVEKSGTDYKAYIQKPRWFYFWKESESHLVVKDGEPVYCFSSVFAPTRITDQVIHDWEWFNPETKDWEHRERFSFALRGGRDAGFRGFTMKRSLEDGKWRVTLLNSQGLMLGRELFEISLRKTSPIRELDAQLF